MRDSVNILVRNNEGKILLQMRDSKPKRAPLAWDFWGGGLEGDEEPLVAASRELSEELTLKPNPNDFKFLVEGSDSAGRVFFVEYLKPLTWKDILVAEGAGAAFFTPEEILQINITDRVEWFMKTQTQ